MSPDAEARRTRAIRFAGLAAVAVVYLRTLHLPSLWLDEAWEANFYVGLAARPWYNRPMLYMLAERLMAAIDPGEFSLRLLPCLAGIGAVVATFQIGRRTGGEACGFIAAGLLAVSESFLSYAHQIKHYAFDALFTTLLVLLYQRHRRTRDVRSLAAWAAVGCVSFGFSFTTPFVIAGIAAVELAGDLRARRRPRPALWLALAAQGVVFAIVFAAFHAGDTAQAYLRDFFVEAWPPAASPFHVAAWWAHQTAHVVALAGGASAIAIGLILVAGLMPSNGSDRESVGTILIGALLANLLASALRLYPYGDVRTSLYLAPLVCVVAGAGVSSLFPRGRIAWRTGLVAAGLAYPLFVYPAVEQVQTYLTTGRIVEDVRAAAADVASRYADGDGIIVTERAAPPFTYYWYRAGKGSKPPNALWLDRNRRAPERNAVPVREAASKHDTLWVYLSAFTEAERRVVHETLAESHERIELVSETKEASLELYRRRAQAPGVNGEKIR